MKKMIKLGMIAAMTITAATMTVPAMAASQITETQAKEIALKDANVLKKNTTFIQVKEEFDDGFQQFDVEFHVGLTEFNYDIDAKTGTILDSDIDIND